MDESFESTEYDPILPDPETKASKPSIPPPLPRLWKSPPEPEEVEEPDTTKSKKKKAEKDEKEPTRSEKARPKKKKTDDEPVDDGTGATKLEETPVLDTFEARQRARWIIGGLLGAIGMIALFIVLKAFRGNGEEEIREGEPPPLVVATEVRPNGEVAARNMLNMAKQADKGGKTQVAIDYLNKLTKEYQGTAASREAMQAIDRNRKNQPLFGVDASEQLGGPKAPNSGSPLPVGPTPPKAVATTTETNSNTNPPKIAATASGPSAATAPTAPVAPSIPAYPLKPLPSGYQAVSDAPVHPSGWPTRIVADRDGAEMVLVPGGTFMMGRDDGDSSERPAHNVTLSTFYIDRHEVTVRQFHLFLKDTGRPIEASKLAAAELPIVNVSAREARAFCNWAGRKLPTEAQWEMAARYPNGRISFWGGELPRKDPLKGPRLMEPVMTLPTDLATCGAYDLAANAWEWTADIFDSQYYQLREFRNPVTDPTGPKESRAKIVQVTVKGGSKTGLLTWRDGQKIETRLPYLGFRGALPVEGAPVAPASGVTPGNAPRLPGGVPPL